MRSTPGCPVPPLVLTTAEPLQSAPQGSKESILRRMNRPHLNIDILLHILSFADKHTIRRLMHTSEMFHRHGARYLLQDDVKIHTECNSQVMSFTQFMLCRDRRGHYYRLPFLRSLKLQRGCANRGRDTHPESSTLAGSSLQLLFTMLARTGNLLKLSIIDAEGILAMHPKLSEAVAALETLEDLSVCLVGKEGVRMLTALQSSLVRATIYMCSGSGEDTAGLERDPTCLLSHSSSSLRGLCIGSTSVGASSLCLPNVRQLVLEWGTMASPLQYYIRAFPNVRDLEVRDESSESEENIEYLDTQRAHNLATHSWPSLDRLRCSISHLYLLGIPGHICCLEIYDTDVFCLRIPGLLDTLLECARPRFLQLGIWNESAEYIGSPDLLETFSRPGCVDALEFLELRLDLLERDYDHDLPALLEKIIPVVVASLKSLTAFSLNVDYHDWRTGSGDSESFLVPLERALEAWDMAAFAHRVRQANPTISSISVSMENHPMREDESVKVGPVYQIQYASLNASP
ncbi:hypothetical protein BD413DRAFT_166985 [Trametes elegans]|nr:hypothetical protein BD413DRAFT_166985 [Trametes elegans]